MAVLLLQTAALSQKSWAQGASNVVVDEVRMAPLLQTTPVIGRLVAQDGGEVAARISGAVEKVYVSIGQEVAEGEVLALIDDAVIAARRDLAEAKQSAAEAAVRSRRAGLKIVRQELERIKGLKSSAAFSQARFEDQQATVAKAEAELIEVEHILTQAKAELDLAELNLFYTEVRSSYPGIITRKHTSSGAYVNVGDPVVSMVSNSDLEIEADMPFKLLRGVRTGTELQLQLADGSRHSASVRAIVPDENPLTRTRAVRFTPNFEATSMGLAPGQSATLQVPVGSSREVLTVAKDAVVPQTDGSIVFVAEAQKNDEGATVYKAAPRKVQLGDALGDRFEVLSGLTNGDQAVIRGNERLRPGAALNISGGQG
ncbi:efflux RND transporter periplasmic adaptor subunit [Rhodovibrionaceae bacterium A322]